MDYETWKREDAYRRAAFIAIAAVTGIVWGVVVTFALWIFTLPGGQ